MVMGLKPRLITGSTLAVALAFGLGACAVVYAVMKIAWLVLVWIR